MDNKNKQAIVTPALAEPKIEADGVLVALGTPFPGEWVKFKRQWLFGDIDDIGNFIPGTRFAVLAAIATVVDWNIKDTSGALIVFDKEALTKDTTPLKNLSAERARALCTMAFVAYAAASRPDPLV